MIPIDQDALRFDEVAGAQGAGGGLLLAQADQAGIDRLVIMNIGRHWSYSPKPAELKVCNDEAAARAAAHGRHVTLDTNFRSTEAMVARVNAMFARAEVRPGGAFAFADDAGAPLLPFQPVRAAGRRETLHHQARANRNLPSI